MLRIRVRQQMQTLEGALHTWLEASTVWPQNKTIIAFLDESSAGRFGHRSIHGFLKMCVAAVQAPSKLAAATGLKTVLSQNEHVSELPKNELQKRLLIG